MTVPSARRWARLSPLLDELLDLAPAARPARLAQWQAEDATLADELRTLLAAGDSEAAARLCTPCVPCTPPAQADAAAVPPAADAADATALAGQRLGPYALIAPLGHGGGGSVWRARRADGRFDGEVAIKLLHLALVERSGAERFRREGQFLARLQHPHIAHLLDAGVSPLGQPYLVLELIDGQPIDAYCDQRRLGIAARLALFSHVLDAVAHAHASGVIHRDIKPGNLLVSTAGAVKLLDFGVAKLLSDETASAPSTELTQQGGRALTPAFASPEQLRGDAVTTASDVYALGVLLYLLLGGRHPKSLPPHADGAPPRLSRGVMLADGASASRPEALAQARGTTPARLARQLAGDLEMIVARAMHLEPSRRYATVAAFADDLRRHQHHQPVAARPDSLRYRARQFVRRNRWLVAGSAALTAAIAAGVGGTLWQAREAQRQAQHARDQFDLAEAMRRVMETALGPASEKPVSVAEVLRRSERMAATQFERDPRTLAFVYRQLAGLWSHGAEWRQTERLLQASRAAAERAHDPVARLQAECVLSVVMAYFGKVDDGLAMARAGVEQARALGADGTQALAECLPDHATLLDAKGHYALALAAIDEATALLHADARAAQQHTLQYLRLKRASVLGSMGRLGPAIAEYEAILAQVRQQGEYDNESHNPTLSTLLFLLMQAGQSARALSTAEELQRRQAGAEAGRALEPTVAYHMANALTQMGHTPRAQAVLQSALEVAGNEQNARLQARLLLSSADAHCMAGEVQPCAQQLQRALQTYPAPQPQQTGAFTQVSLLRARLALLRGEPDAARQALAPLLQALAPEAGKEPRLLSVALALGADIERAAGRAPQAVALARRAVEAATPLTREFPTNQAAAVAWLALAQAQRAAGATAEAEQAAAQARPQWQQTLGAGAPATQRALQSLRATP